jgi:enediyne biosynthesis protein E4
MRWKRNAVSSSGSSNKSSRREALFQLAAGGVLHFTDTSREAGLFAAKNVSGAPVNKTTLLEEMGAGVALIDYDNDGWVDIFLVNGTTLGGGAGSPTSYLFHNNRDGTFRDVTRKAGLTRTGWGQGCCVGDFDNDGFDDLFVSYFGGGALYRNNGDGTFTDVTARAGVSGAKTFWGAGCCFLDFDRDGHLDLFVASYVSFDPARAPKPGSSPTCRYNEIAVPCGPQGFAGGTNKLYRNRGDGTFEDVSEKSGIVNPRGSTAAGFQAQGWRPAGSYGMGAVSADFDNDGWPDIYVACDTAPSLLYHNNHDGTFREVAVPAGCAFDENGTALSGMGAAVGDYDGDGHLDIVRTNFSDQITTVYRNNGDGSFQDASIGAGMGVNRKFLGFGVGLGDFDNDGWKDIFIANGHVYAQLASRKLHIGYKQRRTLYRNLGNGRFADISTGAGPGILAEHASRGCAVGDLDNDGRLDLVVNNIDSPPSLLRSTGAKDGNHWLLVKLRGTQSNRSAIGARVTVEAGGRKLVDEVMSGSSYYSQNDLRLHFGLGGAERVDKLTVRWPAGSEQVLENFTVDRILTIEEKP